MTPSEAGIAKIEGTHAAEKFLKSDAFNKTYASWLTKNSESILLAAFMESSEFLSEFAFWAANELTIANMKIKSLEDRVEELKSDPN